jgi:1,4-dihydroxy-6-naphthoate synthase
MDLGTYWQQETGLPIPLACIAIKKQIDKKIQEQVGRLIKESVEFAFANYPYIAPYVKEHSQTMEEEVMRKHIDLYVNNFSIDLGEKGRAAIEKFYEVYTSTQASQKDLFV